MAEGDEKFNLVKLVSSPFTGLYWVKTVMYSLGGIAIFLIIFSVYKAFIKKPDATQSVVAQTGSTVQVIQNTVRKRYFIPFVEAYVEQQQSNELATGIRAGVRFEF